MEPETSRLSRRTLLSASAGAPLTAALLAGCGTDEPAGPAAPSDAALAAVADIPVGGALVVEKGPGGKPVVLARPRDGVVVAFSAVCTHKGCTVTAQEQSIVCPCHGSTYDLTGANTGGPAPSPLPKVEVTVEAGQVRPA